MKTVVTVDVGCGGLATDRCLQLESGLLGARLCIAQHPVLPTA